jgi:hypothetical protein
MAKSGGPYGGRTSCSLSRARGDTAAALKEGHEAHEEHEGHEGNLFFMFFMPFMIFMSFFWGISLTGSVESPDPG